MHFSLSIGAVLAICAQVYSQDVSGNYKIQQIEDEKGPTLYLGIKDSNPRLQEETNQPSEVWKFASAGEGLVTIQNTETEKYIQCVTTAHICELQEKGQVFRAENKDGGGGNIYSFYTQSSSEVLIHTQDGVLYTYREDKIETTDPFLAQLWLTKVECK